MSVVAGWLAAAGLKGLKNWIWIAIIGAIVAAIWSLVAIADRRHENALDTAAAGSAATTVLKGQAQTLEQLGDANDAEQDLRSGGERSAHRYSGCMLDSRDKAACERFNPDAQP